MIFERPMLVLTEMQTNLPVWLHPHAITMLKPLYDDRQRPIGSKIFVINYGYWLEVHELPHEVTDPPGLLASRIDGLRWVEAQRRERRAALRRGEQPYPVSPQEAMMYRRGPKE